MTNKSARKIFQKEHNDAKRIPPTTSQYITKEKLKSLLPKKTNVAVTDEILALIHNMENDTGLPQELMEEDLMSYMHLLGTSSRGIGMKELINAIKFCNLKRNYTNKESWSIVFPSKYQRLVELDKPIDNHVAMYNSSKLVTMIDKEMLIPVHLQYAPYFHAAVKKQFELMNGKATKNKEGRADKVSPMVQHLAAKELAMLTKQPEEQKLQVSINPGEAAMSMQQEMNDQVSSLVSLMKKRVDSGEDIIDVQAIGIDFSDVGKDNE